MAGTRSNSWCFTINNPEGMPSETDFEDLVYLVFQEEIAPGTGTYHLQGYVRFEKRKTFNAVKTMMADFTPHLEAARGSPEQNRLYCTKLESRLAGTEPYEYGVCPIQTPGARNDILALREGIKAGKTFIELANDDATCGTLARHMPFYNRYSLEACPALPRDDVHVTLCVGSPGTGKSTCAGLFTKEVSTFAYLPAFNGFWDGYTGQTKVIFDEMSGCAIQPTEFNRIIDRGSYSVNIKGSSCPLRATDFWITSNYMPDDWWSARSRWSRKALFRRIHTAHLHTAVGEKKVFEHTVDATGNITHYAIENMKAYMAVMGIERFDK